MSYMDVFLEAIHKQRCGWEIVSKCCNFKLFVAHKWVDSETQLRETKNPLKWVNIVYGYYRRQTYHRRGFANDSFISRVCCNFKKHYLHLHAMSKNANFLNN